MSCGNGLLMWEADSIRRPLSFAARMMAVTQALHEIGLHWRDTHYSREVFNLYLHRKGMVDREWVGMLIFTRSGRHGNGANIIISNRFRRSGVKSSAAPTGVSLCL